MAIFFDAISQGLAAADKLFEDQNEIAQVVDEASREINRATSGLLNLEVREFTVHVLRNRLAEFASITQGLPEEKKVYSGLALISRLEKDSQSGVVSIATWITNKGGYPVKIQHEGEEITCHDKNALNIGIAKVLSSPLTGKKLRTMLNAYGVSSLSPPASVLRRKLPPSAPK